MAANSVYVLIGFYSAMFNLDPKLVASVAQVESRMQKDVVGPMGEIGIMQVRPEYVDVSAQELFKPEVNIRYGAMKLAEAKRHCKHQGEKSWVVCYNLGVTGGSRIKHPKQFIYYRKVMNVYAQYE